MTHRVVSTGIQQESVRKFHATLPDPNGRHLWVFTGMWQVKNPAAERQNFDYESLLTVEGPGCFWCEQVWRRDIGAHCPGDPFEERVTP